MILFVTLKTKLKIIYIYIYIYENGYVRNSNIRRKKKSQQHTSNTFLYKWSPKGLSNFDTIQRNLNYIYSLILILVYPILKC